MFLNDKYEIKRVSDISGLLLGCTVLILIDWSSVFLMQLLFFQLGMCSHSGKWWIIVHHCASPLTWSSTVPVCGHVVRPQVGRCGESSSIILLTVFPELFFLMCLWFWWGIINPSNGSFLRFCSNLRHLLQDTMSCLFIRLLMRNLYFWLQNQNKGVCSSGLQMQFYSCSIIASLMLDKGAIVYVTFLCVSVATSTHQSF